MSPSSSQSILVKSQSISTQNLALSLKLSYCYLTFYIVQIVMASFLCGLLFMDYLELIAFVEVPIVFFIGIDMILSRFVQNRVQTCGRFQITNILVLFGSLVTIGLDMSIPHITRNHVHIVFEIIRVMRFTMQSIWITKLVIQSKRIIGSYQDRIIILQDHLDPMDQQLTKMTL